MVNTSLRLPAVITLSKVYWWICLYFGVNIHKEHRQLFSIASSISNAVESLQSPEDKLYDELYAASEGQNQISRQKSALVQCGIGLPALAFREDLPVTV